MTDQHDTAELTRTAHHEAGHLVAAQAFGRPIVSVSIDHSASRGAHVGIWPMTRSADLIRESLVIYAAGPTAQRIYDPTVAVTDGGEGGDDSQMIALGWTLIGRAYGTGEMLADEMRDAERRAAKLIRDNWQHVEQVARSLLTHHRLVAQGPHVESIGDLDGE